MKALLCGDFHLESGQHLGNADPELGSTRLKDARKILDRIARAECDVLIFLGDLARNARPGPAAYAIATEALSRSPARRIVIIKGNHDHAPGAYSCLNVLGEALGERATVHDKPGLIEFEELQIGLLPWTPTSRLFERARHNPREVSHIAAAKLCDIARGMGAELDPNRPSILAGHWLVAGEKLASGVSVMETQEPIPSALDLEHAGFDLVVFGHNHEHQRVSDRVWSCGPPMRGGFGEERILTGFMRAGWEVNDLDPGGWTMVVEHVPINDRPMVTVTLDAESIISSEKVAEAWPQIDVIQQMADQMDLKAAIVRIRGDVTEAEADRLNANGGRLLTQVVDVIKKAGAHKVIGPQLKVHRERRVRSDLSVEVDPTAALESFLDANDVEEELRPLVRDEAARVMGASAPGKEQ